jgi:predicted CXXCH cytochrome family protein
VRRFALLVAGGALWLFLAAIPAFADGGPHIANINNGTGGLSADTCAQCHRAHTAKAEDLLYASPEAICLTCHDGGAATTNVVQGVQYVPSGILGQHTNATIGALRSGGFAFALIGSGVRTMYLSQPQYVKLAGAATGDTFTLTFEGQTTGTITVAATTAATATNIQNALVALSNVGSTAGLANVYAAQPNMTVSYNTANSWYAVTLQNGLVTSNTTHAVMTGAVLTGTTTLTTGRSSDPAVRAMPRVGVGASSSVTSIHNAGTDVVWGNGTDNTSVGYTLAAGQDLNCAKCHNPHGNNAYRILRDDPGEDWGTTAAPFPNGAAVLVPDDATVNPTTTVRNYTVLPAPLGGVNSANAVAAAFTNTQGDYLRRKTPAWNITNFSRDSKNGGWDGSAATQTNVTAWCVSCHTRYSGLSTNGSPSSLTPPDPNDTHFTYRHGTQNEGCTMCHVAHGSNVAMTGAYSASFDNPAGNAQPAHNGLPGGDSRLLKAPNRGTCQLCHDPTGTKVGGDTVGTLPNPIAP